MERKTGNGQQVSSGSAGAPDKSKRLATVTHVDEFKETRNKKVDDALALVEKMEKEAGETSEKKMSRDSGANEVKSSGIRFHVALDALIGEKDSELAQEEGVKPGENPLFNLKITIPYIWRVPVFGKLALRMVKRLTADQPESIGEILRSLRGK